MHGTIQGYALDSKFKYITDDGPILSTPDFQDVQTYSHQYLSHSYRAMNNTRLPYGLVINFKAALNNTMQDSVIVHLWMINPSYEQQTRFVYVCDYNPTNYCTKITDFWVDIDDSVHRPRTLTVEKVHFKRNPERGTVHVTFNDNPKVHELPYFNTGDDLFLNYAFKTEQAIRLNLMLVYTSKIFLINF